MQGQHNVSSPCFRGLAPAARAAVLPSAASSERSRCSTLPAAASSAVPNAESGGGASSPWLVSL